MLVDNCLLNIIRGLGLILVNLIVVITSFFLNRFIKLFFHSSGGRLFDCARDFTLPWWISVKYALCTNLSSYYSSLHALLPFQLYSSFPRCRSAKLALSSFHMVLRWSPQKIITQQLEPLVPFVHVPRICFWFGFYGYSSYFYSSNNIRNLSILPWRYFATQN